MRIVTDIMILSYRDYPIETTVAANPDIGQAPNQIRTNRCRRHNGLCSCELKLPEEDLTYEAYVNEMNDAAIPILMVGEMRQDMFHINGHNCAICLELFCEDNGVIARQCGHGFCVECFLHSHDQCKDLHRFFYFNWMSRGKWKCPMCRVPWTRPKVAVSNRIRPILFNRLVDTLITKRLMEPGEL